MILRMGKILGGFFHYFTVILIITQSWITFISILYFINFYDTCMYQLLSDNLL
ncbi:hypothetical protein BDC45DRAFT_505923 [Circinella umbellata]|nr:hypothetical protein BDC45DRAFT_505923 [Circinella umbellata]